MSSASLSPFRQLRPGRKDLSPPDVAAIQRARILTAALDTIEEVGYARMTVALVIARARVSRKTFYDIFDDREDCILAALDHTLGETRQLARAAYEAQSNWRDGVRSALASLLDLMDQAPALARLYIVEAPAAGERVLERRARVLSELAQVIDRGRLAVRGSGPPTLTAEALVGGAIGVLHNRLLGDGDEDLRSLLGPLMSLIVLPYLGPRAASQELALDRGRDPASRLPHSAPRRLVGDPLNGLKMRLTYRTILVLAVIAQQPGASNRQVAEGAGITDQGQASKLLSRLASLDLVENLGAGQALGATNAWWLTTRGTQLERAMRRH